MQNQYFQLAFGRKRTIKMYFIKKFKIHIFKDQFSIEDIFKFKNNS